MPQSRPGSVPLWSRVINCPRLLDSRSWDLGNSAEKKKNGVGRVTSRRARGGWVYAGTFM